MKCKNLVLRVIPVISEMPGGEGTRFETAVECGAELAITKLLKIQELNPTERLIEFWCPDCGNLSAEKQA